VYEHGALCRLKECSADGGHELIERGGDDEGRHGRYAEIGADVDVVDERVEVIRRTGRGR